MPVVKFASLIPLSLLALWGLAGCALVELPSTRTNMRDVVVDEAVAQLDRPYRYQGNDSLGFDSAGLAQYAYQKSGIQLPATPGAQRAQGQSIVPSAVRNGDLVFFSMGNNSPQDLHVGIYIGRSRMVHITRNGRVQIDMIDTPYWQRRLLDTVSYLP